MFPAQPSHKGDAYLLLHYPGCWKWVAIHIVSIMSSRGHLGSPARGDRSTERVWAKALEVPRIIRPPLEATGNRKPRANPARGEGLSSVSIGVLIRHIRSKLGHEGSPFPHQSTPGSPSPAPLPSNTGSGARKLASLVCSPPLNPKP